VIGCQPVIAMRILNIVLGIVLVGFAAVQYNDPDVWLWAVLYLVPALWIFAVTFRRQRVAQSIGALRALQATVALYVVAVVVYWPQVPEFWRQDVWMNEETAREGMGVMIALGALLAALLHARRGAADRTAPPHAGPG
jgi:predicted membrane channel-forming protein YqfA (hemolysin III family)